MRSGYEVTPGESGVSESSSCDTQIVAQCLEGNQQAWSVLLEKYRRLIQSIPPKYGATPDDVADIFQAVAMDLFSDLHKLREPQALGAWLIQVTSRRCLQWKHARLRRPEDDLSELDLNLPDALVVPPTLRALEDAEGEERLRAAVARLPERLRLLIRMLFFEQPPRPYKEVAETLGVARGSIPFLRARCLKRLQEILEEMEFQARLRKDHS